MGHMPPEVPDVEVYVSPSQKDELLMGVYASRRGLDDLQKKLLLFIDGCSINIAIINKIVSSARDSLSFKMAVWDLLWHFRQQKEGYDNQYRPLEKDLFPNTNFSTNRPHIGNETRDFFGKGVEETSKYMLEALRTSRE